MKKAIILAAMALLVAGAMVGCGSSSSGSAAASASGDSAQASSGGLPSIEAPKDVLIEHTTFKTMDSDGVTEYVTVFFGHDTHSLKAIYDETHLEKAAGYTLEALESFDASEVYPSINSYKFADVEKTDGGDYLSYIVRFKNLDEKENAQAAVDTGLIIRTDDVENWDYIDADTIIENYAKEATQVEDVDVITSGIDIKYQS